MLTDNRAILCSEEGRQAAFSALMDSSSKEAYLAVTRLACMQEARADNRTIIKEWQLPPCTLNLYDAACALPLRALLESVCGCATRELAIKAFEEDAGMVNVSDLVRYCSDNGLDLDKVDPNPSLAVPPSSLP